MTTIYVDNNATTCVAPEVLETVVPFLQGEYFNPSSMYDAARPAAQAIQQSRASIAQHLGAADPSEILFTSCATESNNTAIIGTTRAHRGRKHIITTEVEHPAVLEVCRDLANQGFPVTFLGVGRDGSLDIDEFVRALTPTTMLVTIMHANNETGVIFPIEELARLTKETDPGIVFHTDATQTVGKLPIDLEGTCKHVDLLSFSGHKLHAPKGVGALYIRRGSPCRPFMLGGHQENGRRAGTENVAFIAGLARALELAMEHQEAEHAELARLRDKLEQGIEASVPCTQVSGQGAPRLPNTLNVSCHCVEGEGMLFQLSSSGICASSGSACTSGSLEPSHVLRAMQVPVTAVAGSVRFSLSRYNTEAEVDRILEVFPDIVASLRRLSPYWDDCSNQPSEVVL